MFFTEQNHNESTDETGRPKTDHRMYQKCQTQNLKTLFVFPCGSIHVTQRAQLHAYEKRMKCRDIKAFRAQSSILCVPLCILFIRGTPKGEKTATQQQQKKNPAELYIYMKNESRRFSKQFAVCVCMCATNERLSDWTQRWENGREKCGATNALYRI